MRILFYGESPVPETGAARVDRYLLDAIVEAGHHVRVLGTSHFWENNYDYNRYPFPITAVNGENATETHIQAGRMIDAQAGTFDVLFISGDMHVPQILIEQVKRQPSIVLGAIDGPVYLPEQVSSFREATIAAVYSHYSYNQVVGVLPEIQEKFHCITLGCEPDVFYPLPVYNRRTYRANAFSINDDTFLVSWFNRNQIRKDPGRVIKAFQLFNQRVPNSKLYMHCRKEDVGGNIASQACLLGANMGKIILTPDFYTEIGGFTRERQNLLYNAADVGISTSQGEGWGLTTSEFMAAGVPFIGPRNTAFFELLGENEERGYLAECGGDDLWSIYYGRDDAPRPITSATSLAKKLYHVYTHRKEAIRKAKAAREWTEQRTWQQFKDQWKGVLAQCQNAL